MNESAAAVLGTQGWRPLNCAVYSPSQGPRFQPLPSTTAHPPCHHHFPCPFLLAPCGVHACLCPVRPVPSPFLSQRPCSGRAPPQDSARHSEAHPRIPRGSHQRKAALERTHHLASPSSLWTRLRSTDNAGLRKTTTKKQAAALRKTRVLRAAFADLLNLHEARHRNTFLMLLQQEHKSFVFKSPQLLCQLRNSSI